MWLQLKELVGVTLGSSSTAAIGQSVFVVGNATGLDHTLTRVSV
jgi:S1-C subfamily serine protease